MKTLHYSLFVLVHLCIWYSVSACPPPPPPPPPPPAPRGCGPDVEQVDGKFLRAYKDNKGQTILEWESTSNRESYFHRAVFLQRQGEDDYIFAGHGTPYWDVWVLSTDPYYSQYKAGTYKAKIRYNLGDMEPGVYLLKISSQYYSGNEVSNPYENDASKHPVESSCLEEPYVAGYPARCGGRQLIVGSFSVTDIWYVNNTISTAKRDGKSWQTAFYSVQDAIDTAGSSDTIWVTGGSTPYFPTKGISSGDNRTKTFLINKNVKIYGGFRGDETTIEERDLATTKTTLSGDIGVIESEDDNCYHVVSLTTADYAVLDGFVIKGGNASGSSNTHGGGIFCDDVIPIVKNCVIQENIADDNGGGIYCVQSDVWLENCLIVNNQADQGGGIYVAGGTPKIVNCTISGNAALISGGGFYNADASSYLVNSIIRENESTSSPNVCCGAGDGPLYQACNIEGSGGSEYWSSIFGIDRGQNIDEEASFEEGQFYLSEDSPCINTGDSWMDVFKNTIANFKFDENTFQENRGQARMAVA
jgi:hypothetical protein